MIIGQTVFATGTYYSPWFPRQGDAATFACESIAVNGATLAIVVQNKNMSQADSSAVTATGGSFSNITTATTTTKRATALLELVRFQYTLTGADNTKWIHFRMLAPAWEAN